MRRSSPKPAPSASRIARRLATSSADQACRSSRSYGRSAARGGRAPRGRPARNAATALDRQRIEQRPTARARTSATSSASRSGANCGCTSNGADALAARDLLLHARIGHAAEAGEQSPVPGTARSRAGTSPAGFAQRRRLRLAADAADAGADIDRRLLPRVEQPRVQHELSVGDGDQIGRDIGAEIAGVGLGDRQRGQRAAAQRRRQFRRPLQQPRVQIEDVAGIGLAARRLARQQRDLAVRRGVLGQVVEHDQRVLAAVAEILGHRHAGERRDPLQPRRAAAPATTKMQRSGAPSRRTASITRAHGRRSSARPRHRRRSCRSISG